MAVIRVDNDGKLKVNRNARRTAAVAAVLALAGAVVYATGDHIGGIFIILCGNTLATIHNLADNS